MATKKPLFGVLAMVLVVLAGALLTEGALRLLSMNDDLYYRIFRNRVGRNTGLYAHDSTLGWKLRPNFDSDVIYPHAKVHERMNSLGWRDQERTVEKPAGVYRIAILGCSRTLGYGVSDDETFAAYLEDLFNESGIKSEVEVLNFGINGFGIGQMVLNYEKFVRNYDPDLVLIQIYRPGVLRSRLTNAWGTEKPRFQLLNEELVLENRPPDTDPSRSLETKVMEASLVYRLVKNGLLRREQLEVESTGKAYFASEKARALTTALLERLKEETQKDGVSLVAFTWGGDSEWFLETGTAAGVETIDLDFMASRLKYRDGERPIETAVDVALNNPPPTGHWSPRGNKFVADSLFEHLQQRTKGSKPSLVEPPELSR